MSTATISPLILGKARTRSLPAELLVRWHLFSLDAPSVAVVWMLLLNRRAAPVRLFVEAAALGMAVWCVYALDRMLDVRHPQGDLRERHHFHRLRRQTFLTGLVLALPAMLVLLKFLPPGIRTAWIVLALPLALYAACVHLFRILNIPKEKCVGIFFAFAVALPACESVSSMAGVLVQGALFGVLCWSNCEAIAYWEREVPSPVAHFRGVRVQGFYLQLALFIVASLGLTAISGSAAVGAPLALSGILLTLLHAVRREVDAVLLRSAADAALLTPMLVMPFIHWHR